MAHPYEWSDDGREHRYDPREEQARRAAQRHAEQEAGRDRERGRRQRGDYASGWWGEEAERQGYDVPGPYGRGSEQRDEEPRSFGSEAERLGRDIGRGWRRLSQGMRRALEDERPPAERDPRAAGGMFGGEDRPTSPFSHGDGRGPAPLGEHRGKGPKGYVRGDQRILEEVCDRLSDDGQLDASGIEVKVEQGEVTLDGQVARREDKRRAEDLAESVAGVKHLQNNLRVRPAVASAESAADPTTVTGQNAIAAMAPGTLGSTGGADTAPQPPGARIAPPPQPRPH
jgi:hypothetical protein